MNDIIYLEMDGNSPEFLTLQNVIKNTPGCVVLGSNDAFIIMSLSMLIKARAELNKLDELLNYMDDDNCESWFAKAFWITDGSAYDATTHKWSEDINKCLNDFGLVSDLSVLYKVCMYAQYKVPVVIPYTGLYHTMQRFAKASNEGMRNYVKIMNASNC